MTLKYVNQHAVYVFLLPMMDHWLILIINSKHEEKLYEHIGKDYKNASVVIDINT